MPLNEASGVVCWLVVLVGFSRDDGLWLTVIVVDESLSTSRESILSDRLPS